MNIRRLTYLTFALTAAFLVAADEGHKLTDISETPPGLSKATVALLNPNGHRLTGPDGTVCDIWLLASPQVTDGFRPTLSVKYPFRTGQLLGALRVAEGSEFTDFRGQPVQPGVYTLRYGKQPEDGNHIGTSELADFLLAIPAAADADPSLISSPDSLHQKSAKTAGSTHPAIFSLLPVDEPAKAASLTHDEDLDFWILSLPAQGKANDKDVPVTVRMVVIGLSDA